MLTKGIRARAAILMKGFWLARSCSSPLACPLCRYVVHVLLAIATIGFAFAHSAILVAIGVAAWVLDLLLRYVWMAGGVMGALLPLLAVSPLPSAPLPLTHPSSPFLLFPPLPSIRPSPR